MNYSVTRDDTYLAHYGVKGMKWREHRMRQVNRSGPGYRPYARVKYVTNNGTGVKKGEKVYGKAGENKTGAPKTPLKKSKDVGKKAVNKIINKEGQKAAYKDEKLQTMVKKKAANSNETIRATNKGKLISQQKAKADYKKRKEEKYETLRKAKKVKGQVR